jgi:hypothetical protein
MTNVDKAGMLQHNYTSTAQKTTTWFFNDHENLKLQRYRIMHDHMKIIYEISNISGESNIEKNTEHNFAL